MIEEYTLTLTADLERLGYDGSHWSKIIFDQRNFECDLRFMTRDKSNVYTWVKFSTGDDYLIKETPEEIYMMLIKQGVR